MDTRQRQEEESKKRKEEEREGHVLRWKSDIPLPPVPDTNFSSFILNVMSHHGGKKALVDSATGKYHTYSDICDIVPRVCANLAAAGVGFGEKVLIFSPNHIDFPIVQLAVELLPATFVPANPTFSPEEVGHVVRVSGARWAVVEEDVIGLLEQVTPLLPPNTLKQVWVIGSSPNYPSFSELMRLGKENTQPRRVEDPPSAPAQTVALMLFSSGTTGLPKGVLLSHRSLLTTYMQNKFIREIRERQGMGSGDGAGALSRVLLTLPLFHIYAHNMLFSTLSAGGCVVLMTKFSLRSFFNAIQRHRITFAPIVPHIAQYLIHSPLLKEYDISSLMSFACGAAPLNSSTLQAVTERTGCGMGVGYGMTEMCATVTSNNRFSGFKMGSVGCVLPYSEVKIVGTEGTKGLPPGEEGEVWVRGPGMMLGYAEAPDTALRSSWLKEGGWLATGDLGYCDEEGFLFITDRIKDIIKVKGFQVASSEIEEVLGEVDGVREVAVIGVPSSRLGEAPRAYVVPLQGVPTPSPQTLKDHVAARLAPHKQLAGGVEVVEALPKSSLGKVLKRRLREDYLKSAAAAAGAAVVPPSKL